MQPNSHANYAPTLAKEQEPNDVHSPKANEDDAGLWLRAETSSLSSWLNYGPVSTPAP